MNDAMTINDLTRKRILTMTVIVNEWLEDQHIQPPITEDEALALCVLFTSFSVFDNGTRSRGELLAQAIGSLRPGQALTWGAQS